VNYDTSILLIANKSGAIGYLKMKKSLPTRYHGTENKSHRQSFSLQIGQHWNRQAKAASELEQGSMPVLTDLPSNVLSRQTSNGGGLGPDGHGRIDGRMTGRYGWGSRWVYVHVDGWMGGWVRGVGEKCCELWRGRAQVDPSNCSNPMPVHSISCIERWLRRGRRRHRSWRMAVTVADTASDSDSGSEWRTRRLGDSETAKETLAMSNS